MKTIKLNDEIFKELHILKKSEWDRTNFKIKKGNPFSAVCIVEKTAYLHYNFRLFSYAE